MPAPSTNLDTRGGNRLIRALLLPVPFQPYQFAYFGVINQSIPLRYHTLPPLISFARIGVLPHYKISVAVQKHSTEHSSHHISSRLRHKNFLGSQHWSTGAGANIHYLQFARHFISLGIVKHGMDTGIIWRDRKGPNCWMEALG